MKGVLKIMDQDHEDLAKLFSQFLLNVHSGSEKSVKFFSQFGRRLQKHFKWEEEILFPLFEERTGPSGLDTTFVLKNEHIQIKSIFLDKIKQMLSDQKYSDIANIAVGLEEMLTMHRNYETNIFYPWFDESLDELERVRVLKLLKDKFEK